MIEEYLKNGKVTYHSCLSKEGTVSVDMFEIRYDTKVMYLLCTFDGYKLIRRMLIS